MTIEEALNKSEEQVSFITSWAVNKFSEIGINLTSFGVRIVSLIIICICFFLFFLIGKKIVKIILIILIFILAGLIGVSLFI